ELFVDCIFLSVYIFLLIRIRTATESYFKSQFFTFFMITGVYNVISVVAYHFTTKFHYTETLWTVHLFKLCYALNAIGAAGSTVGKTYITIHRYCTLRDAAMVENV
ncbi:hypothetical protein PFISCL1PPCAC_26675, partial [Pristionchus fissidentatus]